MSMCRDAMVFQALVLRVGGKDPSSWMFGLSLLYTKKSENYGLLGCSRFLFGCSRVVGERVVRREGYINMAEVAMDSPI